MYHMKCQFVSSGIARFLALVFLSFPLTSPAQYAGTNGIFAEFTTSMGNFTCRLDQVLAPKTVANFIGLATGQRAWLDLPTGAVKAIPFYNGTIFHRVIAGFVNQGGSPNGQGTDGPGFTFQDEFHPSLLHDSFGVLSMANSGPDSNGSQYFITAAPQPGLNNVHSVFGRLYGGSNVVYAINRVVTGAADKPLTNVVVQSVVIQRIGPAAQAFDINAQGLPLVTNLNLEITKGATTVSLTYSNRIYSDTRCYATSDLVNWAANPLGIENVAASLSSLSQSVAFPRRFFRAVQVQYTAPVYAPRTIGGRTFTFNFTQGRTGTLVVNFNAANGGTYVDNGSPGNLYGYDWQQGPFNGKLLPLEFIGPPLELDMTLTLKFSGLGAGTFTGVVYPFYFPNQFFAYAVAGTFILSP